MSNDFDRNLYTPYDLPINPNKTIFKYEGKLYECNGDSVDQGGQHEINLTKLKEHLMAKVKYGSLELVANWKIIKRYGTMGKKV